MYPYFVCKKFRSIFMSLVRPARSDIRGTYRKSATERNEHVKILILFMILGHKCSFRKSSSLNITNLKNYYRLRYDIRSFCGKMHETLYHSHRMRHNTYMYTCVQHSCTPTVHVPQYYMSTCRCVYFT